MGLRTKNTLQSQIQTDINNLLTVGGRQTLRGVLDAVEARANQNTPDSIAVTDTKDVWTTEMAIRISNAVAQVVANYLDAFVREADIKPENFQVMTKTIVVDASTFSGPPAPVPLKPDAISLGDMNA